MRVLPPECRLPEKCPECGQLIEPADESPFEVGDLVLRPGFRYAEWQGRRVQLPDQQFRLLLMLAKRGSARREALYEQVFQGLDEDGPEPKIIDVQICKLRQSLASIGAGGIVKTIWGRGYALDVENLSPPRPTGQMRRELVLAR